MAKTRSKLSLSQRRERAFVLFAKGYTNTDVKKDLRVTMETVKGYREIYEKNLHARAAAQPDYISDVVVNTFRTLAELDQVRAEAWKHMEDRTIRTEHECPACEHTFVEREKISVSDQTRAQYLNILLKAQAERAKIFGVLGVKQEVFIEIMRSQALQDKVLGWLSEHVKGELRDELASFIEGELNDSPRPFGILDVVGEEVVLTDA